MSTTTTAAAAAAAEFSPDFDHGHARFEEAADMLADLSVGLCCLPEVVPQLLVGFIHHPLLLVRGAPRRSTAGRRTQLVVTALKARICFK